MTEALTPILIGAVAVAIAVGVLIGVGLMLLMQRSQTGGKTLAALRQEQEDYEQSVEQHFERSAVLFKKLTDDYRAFYEHMASGAHTLCKHDEPVIQPLELSRSPALSDESASDAGQTAADDTTGQGDETEAPKSEAPTVADQPPGDAGVAPSAPVEQNPGGTTAPTTAATQKEKPPA